MSHALNVFRPKYHVNECLEEIKDSLVKGWTGLGDKTVKLEEVWKDYTGVPYAHFVNSATAGLHLAVKILKDEGAWEEDSEIISTPLSVTYNTPIIFKKEGKPNVSLIGSLIDSYYKKSNLESTPIEVNDLEVLSIDDNFKCSWKKVSYVLKHKNNKKIYKITTKYGYNVECTEDHSVFIFKEGSLITKKASDLKKGDYLVSYHKIEEDLIENYELNLIDYLINKDLRIYNLSSNTYDLIRDNIKNKFNISNIQDAVPLFNMYKKQDNLPIEYMKYIDTNSLNQYNIGGSITNKLPNKINITELELFILGLYTAEGSLTKNGISFSLHKNELHLKNRIAEFAKKYDLGFSWVINDLTSSLRCEIFGNVIKDLFEELCYDNTSTIRNASTKVIPAFVFSLINNYKFDYFNGYFEGDGHLSKQQVCNVTTVSKLLAVQLGYLLNSLNIKHSFYIRPEKSQVIYKNSKVSDCKAAYCIEFTKIVDSSRTGRLNSYVPNKETGISQRGISKKDVYVDINRFSAEKQNVLNKYIKYCDYPVITNIEETCIDTEYVYDVSVPEIENFIGGVGGLLLHNTFVSTNHAISYENLKVVFADVDEYLCLDPISVVSKITEKTKAIMFVGYGGNIGKFYDIVRICEKYNLKLIFDAAHCAGTRYKGIVPGKEADMIVYSFQAVKNMCTADSGMLCCKTKEQDTTARKLSWLGIDKDTYNRTNSSGAYKWKYNVEQVGYKYHGNSLTAAVGLVELNYLDQGNAYRRQVAKWYDDNFKTHTDIINIVPVSKGCETSRHLYVIEVDNRDKIMLALNQDSIFPGVHYISNTDYDMYLYAKGTVPNAERMADRIISLPVHLELTKKDVDFISTKIIELVSA